jgi:hypothetical protein
MPDAAPRAEPFSSLTAPAARRSDALVEVAGAELGVVVTQCLLTPLSRERGGHSHRTPGAVQTLLRLRYPAFSAFVEDRKAQHPES